jgi:hypothetical protein
MLTRSWIRRLFDRKPRTVRKTPGPVSGRDRGFRPRLEGLEDRTLLTLTLNAFAPPLITADDVVFPLAIAVGDLTGNGLPNVVAVDSSNWQFGSTSQTQANVVVFSQMPGRGYGLPSYVTAAGDGSDAFFGIDVALGNFDGRHYANGKPVLDMAVAVVDQSGFMWVSILKNTSTTDSLGNTTLSFGSPTIYNTWGTDVTVGDFNGDGRDDVLMTGAGSTPLLHLNNGDGTFQSARDLGGDVSGRGAVVGNFDGRKYDNGLPILDVAVVGGKGIDVLMNNGDGTFKAPVSYGEGLTQYQLFYNDVAAGDFNGDGKLDLSVANAGDSNVNVLMGEGDGTFQPAVNYAVGPNPRSVGVGDFNGDGKLDIAVANDNGNDSSVSVLQGTGTGTFLKAQNFAEIRRAGESPAALGTMVSSGGLNYSDLAVGDFAGNGYSGVAVLSEVDANNTSAAIYVMQGAGQSFFQPPVQLPGASGAVVAEDFNGDGKTDAAFNNANGIQVFLRNGDGAFSNPIDASVGNSKVLALAPGDFNSDGNLGLLAIWGQPAGELYAFPGNGDGTFNPFHLDGTSISHDINSAAAGDFTGNGKVDIATINGGRLDIYMQNSDGTFGLPTPRGGSLPTRTYQVGGTGSIAVGDFNGDGKPDLVVGGRVLLGNGDGTFQSPVSYGGGLHVAVADFDGRHDANGQPILDLVTTVDDGVNVSLGNGDGTFQNPVFYRLTIPPDNNPWAQPLAVGDFNGDGNLDIAVGCRGGTVSVLLGNGDGTFQSPYSDQVSDSSRIAAADFTGDGRSEIVTASGQILSSSPDFSLSNASVAEQQPAGTLVGTFNTPNGDPNNFFTYTFVGGTGGADNAAFTIDAQGNLHTAASFDYATKSSYSIRVRSTDIVGEISEGVFTIGVLDVNDPPTVATNLAAVRVTESSPAAATGTFGDLDGAGTVTLTASLGTLTRDNAARTWAWSYTPPDGPAGPTTVTITATDDGGLTATTTFSLTVDDIAPTAGVTGPSGGVRGQLRTFTFTASDPSAADQAAGFTFAINWGDGSPVQNIGPGALSGSTAGHAYAASGTYTVTVTATDKDGLAGPGATTSVDVVAIQLQNGLLAVGGTTGNDAILVKAGGGGTQVVLGGVTFGPYAGVTSLALYGQAGDDNLEVKLKLPALLDGGAGNDTLTSGAGDNILLGGAGNDQLFGNAGRDLLIGGLGADLLRGGKGDDLVIGGTTDFDANQAALDAIMAEWTRTDAGATYNVRIGHLRDGTSGGLNGSYRLNATTVHNDGAIDELRGDQDNDWFFALTGGLNADLVKDKTAGEIVTPL